MAQSRSVKWVLAFGWLGAAAIAAEDNAKPLRLALTPYRPAAEMLQRYQPLADRLHAATHQPVKLLIGSSFGAPGEWLKSGEADIAELTPSAFVDVRASGAIPLVTDAMLGRSGTGVIVELARAKPRSAGDLKGSTFGFVDVHSTSGYLAPYASLKSVGIVPARDFNAVRFLGSHLAVMESLERREIDAGALSRLSFEQYLAEHKKSASAFHIVLETPRTPGDVFVARPGLEPAVVKRLAEALLSLDEARPADRRVLEPMGRRAFAKVDLKDYAWLARIVWSVEEDAQKARSAK